MGPAHMVMLSGEADAQFAEVLEVLGPYSEALGIAYQIHDDLDDFTGDGDSDDFADLRPSLIMAIAHKRAAGGESDAPSLQTRIGASSYSSRAAQCLSTACRATSSQTRSATRQPSGSA